MPPGLHALPFQPAAPTDAPRSPANWAIRGIFLILVFAAIGAGRAFLMPVTLAILLFFVFSPLRRFAQRRGVPESLTAGAVTLGILALLGGLTFAAYGPAQQAIDNLPTIRDRLETKVEELKVSMGALGEAAETIVEPAATTVIEAESGEVTKIEVATKPENSTVATVAAMAPDFVSQLLFTLVLLFFMMASGDMLYLKIVQSFDRMRDKRAAYSALREIESSLGSYLSAITIINAGLGLAIGLAMWAWGMPAPILFGIGGFVANFIPFIGALAGVGISFFVALIVMDGVFWPAMVGLTFLALTSLEGQFVTPYFVSRRLQMNEVVVFVAVALWAWLWSVLGMVIAVPVLVVLRVLSEHIPGWEKFGNFLAGEAAPKIIDEDEDGAGSEGPAPADAPAAGARPAE